MTGILLIAVHTYAPAQMYFGGGGFMIEASHAVEEKSLPSYHIPSRKPQHEVFMPTSGTADRPETALTPQKPPLSTPSPSRSSAQNIAVQAGIPTIVSTMYNPAVEIRGISWGTAATSALGGALLGIGVEIYDQAQMEDGIHYLRVAQTGALLGGATFAGVVAGQAVQHALLINSGLLGMSAGNTGAQLFSGFMGDAVGSSLAAAVYATGAYAIGWADPADVRAAIARGVTGSVIMAAGKAVGIQTLFSLTGASGTAATLGPYAITYLAALGAVYITDQLFDSLDRSETQELLERELVE